MNMRTSSIVIRMCIVTLFCFLSTAFAFQPSDRVRTRQGRIGTVKAVRGEFLVVEFPDGEKLTLAASRLKAAPLAEALAPAAPSAPEASAVPAAKGEGLAAGEHGAASSAPSHGAHLGDHGHAVETTWEAFIQPAVNGFRLGGVDKSRLFAAGEPSEENCQKDPPAVLASFQALAVELGEWEDNTWLSFHLKRAVEEFGEQHPHASMDDPATRDRFIFICNAHGTLLTVAAISVDGTRPGRLNIDYVATNPKFRMSKKHPQRAQPTGAAEAPSAATATKGGGKAAIKAAVLRSIERAFDGNITLEAGSEGIPFYRHLRMPEFDGYRTTFFSLSRGGDIFVTFPELSAIPHIAHPEMPR